MKKVIIYGGAFNPPTRAHQAILQAVVNKAAEINADVWLMLSGQRKDKAIASSREVRMKYTEALLLDIDRMGVNVMIDTTEIDSDNLTETYQTARDINSRSPKLNLIWVFGSDSVSTMGSWRGGSWLLENIDMLVVQRPGYEVDKLPYRAEVLPVNAISTSSTEVSSRLAGSLSVDELVSPNVLSAILSMSAESREV